MKKLLTLVLLSCSIIGNAQDIHFSQFSQTPLLVNPANAGFYNGYERFILNHKSQWTSIGSPFKTTAASFDLPFFFGNGTDAYLGTGIAFYSDKAGDSKFGTNQVLLSIAGIIPLDKRNKISGGLQLGIGQRSAKIDDLTWGNQFDGDGFNTDLPSNEANTLNSFAYPDLGVGINYEFDNTQEKFDGYDEVKFNIGASISHVNRPILRYTSAPDDRVDMKFIGYMNLRYDIPGSKVSFMPQAMYVKQGPHQEIYGGAALRFQLQNGTKFTGLIQENALLIGIQTRLKDALTPSILVELTDYTIGFSYDLSISNVGSVNRAAGGFEVVFKYVNLKDALWKRKTRGRFK